MGKFRVYFDGDCLICNSEIAFYRRKKGAELIEWVDIQSEKFDAKVEHVSLPEMNRIFHVKDENGRWITGVDAFVEIWKRIPSLKMLATAARIPGSHALMKIGYNIFVRVRPYLPRKAGRCLSGSCEARSKSTS